ncbi:RNA polymerase-associated protein RapA [Agitococcus lubricus]|uniref:RNA polymerase-associated protein RapA n=1 Tax=Agitococcus lubricus TaxID=1077255 RepID=A0A2T5IWE7_9GAMM|nr:RNA polymerase-associated protein RapA [Agitococcus lubricus]PTQ88248.1 ATP-dependent helicase HepA [Agitococcus lubricus]
MSIATPAIGQRWLSDAETELGLGMIVEVNARTLTILFPKSEETRVYARQNAPLSRIRFNVGDTVKDTQHKSWLVTGVQERQFVLKYEVQDEDGQTTIFAETRLSPDIQLARPCERLLACQLDNNEWYELRVTALRAREKLAQSPVAGLVGPRVGLIPHQFYIAHEVGQRMAPRVLLADEVGLGKTIEAGLIIHQQLLTGRAQRILVLVPDSLQYQWLVEMRRRFNINFALFDLTRTAAIKEGDESQNPFLTEQCVLASIDLLIDHPDLKQAALEATWDLLVVDEAHHLAWDEEKPSEAYQLVEEIAQQTAGVLLLTATPEQLGVASHFARLKLLDPKRFSSLDHFLDEEESYQPIAQAARQLVRGQLDDDTRQALTNYLGNNLDLDSTEGRDKAIVELLDRHGTGRVLFRNTREAIKGFPSRECLPVPLTAPADWPMSGPVRQQLWPEIQADDDEWLQTDPRVPWLIQLLKKLKQQKVLLICRTAPVAMALELRLRLNEGIRTALFHEEMTLIERDRAAAYFAEPDYGAQILLCSEIGSEGRNFQFAHHLVIFDLPANPDVLEQRIGRLDRIGQTETIKIHVPYMVGTAQERLFVWHHDALNAISHISPTAQTVHQYHQQSLKDCLQSANQHHELFNALVAEAKQDRSNLEAELQQGRDYLLELNSCRMDKAIELITAVADQDDDLILGDFMERAWSAFGVEHEEQGDGSHIIRTGEHMAVDSFPSLDADGMTVCFDRNLALSREDIQFVTWEHPMSLGILDLMTRQSFGNANLALIRNKGIKAGTLLMEAWFRVELVAPKHLDLTATLPQLTVRVLLDGEGRDLSTRVNHEILNRQVVPLDKATARQVVKMQADMIASLYQQADKTAKAHIPDLKTQAQSQLTQKLGVEIERLKALQKINPSIRDEEIELLSQQLSQGLNYLQDIHIISDALRIIVAA